MSDEVDKRKLKIQELLDEASGLLEQARELSEDTPGWFHFSALGYGAGADLMSGEWMPSSQSC